VTLDSSRSPAPIRACSLARPPVLAADTLDWVFSSRLAGDFFQRPRNFRRKAARMGPVFDRASAAFF